MTVLNRMLAIRAIAAGAYKVAGPCHDCGQEEALVAFPQPFVTTIAICRRCRFTRTGIPDRRNLIQGEARVAGEQVGNNLETTWKQPVALLPARCETPIETDDQVVARLARLRRPFVASVEPPLSDVEADRIFGDWNEEDDADLDRAIIASEETDEEREERLLREMGDLSDELDEIFAEVDRRLSSTRGVDSNA